MVLGYRFSTYSKEPQNNIGNYIGGGGEIIKIDLGGRRYDNYTEPAGTVLLFRLSY